MKLNVVKKCNNVSDYCLIFRLKEKYIELKTSMYVYIYTVAHRNILRTHFYVKF